MKKYENIVEASKHFVKKIEVIDGYEIITFNYRDGAKYRDFEEFDAFEMRGLSFVNGVKFPMIHKFFNAGERYPEELKELLDKKVKSIQIKDDGSLIGFIILPNGRVIPKTKAGFSNDFTKIAKKWLGTDNNEDSIKDLYSQDILPLFECVSDKHKIVLDYEWEGLKLIQARTTSGKYLEVSELSDIAKKYNFVFEEPKNHTLSELLKMKSTYEGIEGFIVRFEDDSFCKVKTDWYFELHMNEERVDRVNEILSNYFKGENEKLDIDYEVEFLSNVKEKVLEPFEINSLLDLKNFLFGDTDEKQLQIYRQIFKKFLREYSLANNYNAENTIIKLTVENSIDDILPNLTTEQRIRIEEIQDKVNQFILETTNNLVSILEKGISHKEITTEFKGTTYLNIAMKYNGKDWNFDSIEQSVKEQTMNMNKKVVAAREFISKL